MSNKKKHIIRSKVHNWGNSVRSQNNMTNEKNPYNHLTESGDHCPDEVDALDSHKLVYRGRFNHAPQKDLELGKKSITHKSISEKIAKLVAGNGLGFRIAKPESDDTGVLNDDEILELEIVEELMQLGLGDTLPDVANGIVYQSLGALVITQEAPSLRTGIGEKLKDIKPNPIAFTGHPSDTVRVSDKKMNSDGKSIVDWHYYHADWGFARAMKDCNKGKDEKAYTPDIVKIEEYIKEGQDSDDKPAFAVRTMESEKSDMERFISVSFKEGKGIFDNAYPLPRWKTNSSINDIQNEFETSCLRTDFLMNGLHIFAIVNIYSMSFNVETNAEEQTHDETQDEDLEVVKAMKGSFNSGRIIVNSLATTDPEKDGKIEVEKIELNLPEKTIKYFNEESRAGILTAHGVDADLFSITKPEKNNLRSQEANLRVSILNLKQDVTMRQEAISKRYDEILKFYGITRVKTFIKPQNNNLYLTLLMDFAKQYMRVNDIREKILGEERWTDEELAAFITEQAQLAGRSSDSQTTQTPEDE